MRAVTPANPQQYSRHVLTDSEQQAKLEDDVAGDVATKARDHWQHRTLIKAFGSGRFWCGLCARPVSTVTIEQASVLLRIRSDMFFERIADGEIHCMKMQTDDLLLCLESLLQSSRMTSKRNKL